MMKQHPLSAAFPAMATADLAALTEDIASRGLKQPVVIFEGMVLDGWHRYSACLAAGMSPKLVDLESDEDPVAFVLSMNMQRRHLTASQRAAAIVACSEWRGVGSNQHDGGSAPGAEALAEQADVSVRTLHHAKVAHDAGLGDIVRDGEVSAKQAADLAKGKTEPAPRQKTNNSTRREEPAEERDDSALEETLAELQAELAAAERIIESDSQAAGAWLEVKAMREKHDALEKLYTAQREELSQMTREAQRWKRKADDLEKKLKGGK